MKKISLNELTISSFITKPEKVTGGEKDVTDSREICFPTNERHCTKDCY
ncbi:MAG: hypothetical protein WBH03_10495 [Cyclobacteriaceae bacterium]